MEKLRTLFCSSKSLWTQEKTSLKFIDNLGTRPKTFASPAPVDIAGNNSYQRLSRTPGRSAAGRIKSMKISTTPQGIESAAFRLVTLCLNQPLCLC